jgi:hypothetical protein
MNTIKTLAIVLVIAGALGLVYGSFTYTKDSHDAKLGPIELSVKDKETVNIPVWAGVGAILIGGVLLLVGNKQG